MAEIKPREIESWLKRPNPACRAVLLYGADQGLVRDYSIRLAHYITPDLGDAFQVARLGMKNLADSPSLLADEMASYSLLGGRRLIWLEGADKGALEPVKLALEGIGDGFLLLSAGELKKTDALVKFMIASPAAAVIACYGDEGAGLRHFIQANLQAAGLRASPEAMDYLLGHLGIDRMVTRQELDKLALYMAADGKRAGLELGLKEAQAVIGDAAAFTLFQIGEAVSKGDKKALEEGLERAWIAGENAIALLRLVQMRFIKLHLARAMVDSGEPAAMVLKKLGVFWKEADGFTQALRRWPLPKLERALDILLEAEEACKETASPAQLLCSRALLSITKAA